MTPKIFYKSGYKYQLQADCSIQTGITGYNAGNAFCHLSPDGQLDIHAVTPGMVAQGRQWTRQPLCGADWCMIVCSN